MTWLPRKRILVPIDFSEAGVKAIQNAMEMVESPSDIHVLYVLTPTDFTSPGVVLGNVNDETRIASATEHMDQFLKRHEIEGVTRLVQSGDPGLVISDYAAEASVDLIVMPSHGHHGIRRVLLGSVAERVLRHAECPVLVLRRSDID